MVVPLGLSMITKKESKAQLVRYMYIRGFI